MGHGSSKVSPLPPDEEPPGSSQAAPQRGDAPRHYVLMVGNPGSGKSTLLNALIGKRLFHSGFSPGQGLTTQTDIKVHDNIGYVDTPGLADAHLRKVAAENITAALQKHGGYKLLFVATLEGWNFRAQDKVTLELVLDAIQHIEMKNKYGIIVNKVPKESKGVTAKLDELYESFFSIDSKNALPTTRHITYLREEAINDESEATLKLQGKFLKFIERIPVVFLDKEKNVKNVQVSKFAERLEELRAQQADLMQKKEEMREEVRRLMHLEGWNAEEESAAEEAKTEDEVAFEKGDEVVALKADKLGGDVTVSAGATGKVTNVLQRAIEVRFESLAEPLRVEKLHWKNLCKKDTYFSLKVNELAHRGITLGALLSFYAKLLARETRTDFKFDPNEHTTADVARRMISHNWSNKFAHLIAAIVADALDNDCFGRYLEQLQDGAKLRDLTAVLDFSGKLRTPYWVCAFSVNQHLSSCKRSGCPCASTNLGNDSPQCEVNKFDAVMEIILAPDEGSEGDPLRQPRHVIAVDQQCQLFTRAWVVAELVVALTLKQVFQKYKFHDTGSVEALEKTGIDVRSCKASRPEDKAEVLAKAEKRISERGDDWNAFHAKLHGKVFEKIKRDIHTDKVYVLCIGNVGVGKTYILNKMIGKEVFTVTSENEQAVDSETPMTFTRLGGLADPKTCAQAANAITTALKRDGVHKIFIVTSLEAGRVRSEDGEMIMKILEAAPAIQSSYNVVINKVSPADYRQFSNPSNRKRIAAALFSSLKSKDHLQPTDHIWYVEKSSTDCSSLPPRMLEDAVKVRLGPGQVEKMTVESEEEKAEKLQEVVKKTQEENRVLDEEILKLKDIPDLELLQRHTELLKMYRELGKRIRSNFGSIDSVIEQLPEPHGSEHALGLTDFRNLIVKVNLWAPSFLRVFDDVDENKDGEISAAELKDKIAVYIVQDALTEIAKALAARCGSVRAAFAELGLAMVDVPIGPIGRSTTSTPGAGPDVHMVLTEDAFSRILRELQVANQVDEATTSDLYKALVPPTLVNFQVVLEQIHESQVRRLASLWSLRSVWGAVGSSQ